jgi:hypothetical protein
VVIRKVELVIVGKVGLMEIINSIMIRRANFIIVEMVK